MGIITRIKENAKNSAISAAKKGADAVATASQFSPKQIAVIDKKREQYLQGKPSVDGAETEQLIERNLGAVGVEIFQAYLPQIKDVYVPVDMNEHSFDVQNRIRYFDITRWVLDVEENYIDKLVNVYHVLSEEDCNIALLYRRTQRECRVSLAVVNNGVNDPSIINAYEKRILGAIKGNFPGAEVSCDQEGDCGIGTPIYLKETKNKSVATISNLAAEKSEKFISQSMEKLLDGIVPEKVTEEYTIVLLATPIKEQFERKNRLYDLYSKLAPYSTWQTNYTYSQSDAVNAQADFGINLGLGAGGQIAKMDSIGMHVDDAHGKMKNGGISACFKKIAIMLGGGTSDTHTIGSNVQNGQSIGMQANANFGMQFSRASSVTAQIGKNEGITQNYTNYGVANTLEIIEKQMKRLEESSALGMWDFAAYVVSEDPVITNNVAHMYLALTQGEDSYMAQAAINLWHGTKRKEEAEKIVSALTRLQHPIFRLKDGLPEEWYMYPTAVDASTALSGKELAYALNFPRKSVSGLPVIESVSFGREVHRYSNNKKTDEIKVGNIYHMKKSEARAVSFDIDSLTSHTFITGSTGSGKSNTVYQLLASLKGNDKHFLVIEPAKGNIKIFLAGMMM